MADDLLGELLDRNDDHVAALGTDAFADHREGQRPPIVSVCCSDSRVSQEGMWAVDRPGFLFTAGNIGNRVRAVVDGDPVLDGSVAYPLGHTGTEVLAVVGHTGCGAVGAALNAAWTGEYPPETGVRADVAELVPIVEDGLSGPAVDGGTDGGSGAEGTAGRPGPEGTDTTTTWHRLVEYNVHEQVAFALGDDAAVDADVYGFVYDFHRAYGDRDGAAYLVNANGERDVETLRERVGDAHADHVGSLL